MSEIRHKLHELKGIIGCGEDPETAYSSYEWKYVTCGKCNINKIRKGDKYGVQAERKAKSPRLKASSYLKVKNLNIKSRKETDESLDSDFGFIPRKTLKFGDTWNMGKQYIK